MWSTYYDFLLLSCFIVVYLHARTSTLPWKHPHFLPILVLKDDTFTTRIDDEETEAAENVDDVTTYGDIEARKWHGATRIAFMSHLSEDHDELGLGQHIKFDEVSLNDGDAYDADTGVFM